MKILFITTKGPLPLNDGHSLRSFHLLQQVARVHEVHLLSFIKSKEEHQGAEGLKQLCRSVEFVELKENISKVALGGTLARSFFSNSAFLVHKYNSCTMRQKIRHILARHHIDIVHFDMLPLAVYMDEAKGSSIVLNEHNVESVLLARRLENEKNPLIKWFYGQQKKQLEIFERTAVSRADCVLACSDRDKAILKRFNGATPVVTIPNGVDTDYFTPSPESFVGDDNKLIFVGGLNWRPNLDALKWFDRLIFPHVLLEYPRTSLHIIGQGRPIGWRHPENVVCHGPVKDIRPYMANAAVFIVPLRFGSGTRLKILNAMAAGKAVVSTSIGAEGLKITAGKNIILADRDYHFARSICRLLGNREKRRKLGQSAHQLIVDNYQWRDIGKVLLSTYDKLPNNR